MDVVVAEGEGAGGAVEFWGGLLDRNGVGEETNSEARCYGVFEGRGIGDRESWREEECWDASQVEG